jgi:hypothetical protein
MNARRRNRRRRTSVVVAPPGWASLLKPLSLGIRQHLVRPEDASNDGKRPQIPPVRTRCLSECSHERGIRAGIRTSANDRELTLRQVPLNERKVVFLVVWKVQPRTTVPTERVGALHVHPVSTGLVRLANRHRPPVGFQLLAHMLDKAQRRFGESHGPRLRQVGAAPRLGPSARGTSQGVGWLPVPYGARLVVIRIFLLSLIGMLDEVVLVRETRAPARRSPRRVRAATASSPRRP